MAILNKGKTFTNGELVTPQKLHELVDLGTVSGIVNADINASAAIALSKLATGALPAAITVASANIVDGSIVNADIANTAAIADTKLATISTAGKVANSATTATAANAANAIVARDGGGSFSAGTITASLAGNAATATTAASCSGNAATATTLQTARTINGVSFNGSANITVTADPNAHTHTIANVTGLQSALDGKQAAGSYAASSHNHDASNITSGTISNARTTARNLRLADYVAANPLDPASYAGQLLGKIAIHDSSTATIDAFGLNTFGVTSYSPGANSGVYSVNAVSKPGADLVQTYIGGILSNNTNTGVIYGTASDYRLKTNIEPLTGALARLAALPVRRFHWLGHTDSPKVDGFLAHEAQAIVPEAVTGTKDAVDAEGNPIHQGIDQSKLVPLLVAAVQELAARVAALEPAK